MNMEDEDEDMPKIAGGEAPVSNFEVDGGDSATVKGVPPPPPLPPAAPVMPQAKPPMMAAAPASAPKPMPGMPANVTPDDLRGFLDAQKAGIEKYGPDRGFNATQAMLKGRMGVGGSLANAGATLADGIMQGVARAGNPGFAAAQEARANDLTGQQAGNIETARKGMMEQTEAEQKIDMQDPHSPTSKAYQRAFAPIFQRMGYPADKVMSMPASQINTVADLGVRYADAQTQLELKKAMLQVQTLTAQASIANNQSERRQSALKDLQGMPWYSRAMHPGISGALEKEAGLAGPEHPQANEAMKWAADNPNDPRAAEIIKRLK